ncbi:AAA family ATPase [Salinibacterium sp. NG22]|uniref:ATP-dependent nuclease n=1 Tax=Salinibacterium sp. NG22 TaxID=2792040 RepID=UPI0018CF8A2F|nr:AAA family ATPase [Salinibacterium sp. NG22]MBH0109364.1 AAA family ATPase [Salinibacterium sp. NG22]
MIERLLIQNFLRFEHLEIEFDSEMNILVGDNDTGKSTIMSALEMALTGRLGGRTLDGERSPHWFTKSVSEAWIMAIQKRSDTPPPVILIEAYFRDSGMLVALKGKNNSLHLDVPGIRLEVQLDPAFAVEYAAYVTEPEKVTSIPIEFFRVDRHDFAGEDVSRARPVVTAALIDASTLRLQSGTDYYLRKSISDHLDLEARAKLSLAFRNHKEALVQDPAFVAANDSIKVERTTLSKKSLTLSSDASAKSSWESGLVPHLDSIPFDLVGQGEQSAFKILLALEKDGTDRHVVMVEEPENHLSHSNLSKLISRIRERSSGQQVFLTTHSSFVLNKLGIDKLRLLSESGQLTLGSLPNDTKKYFAKLAGYDTLRMVLAKSVVLVEGPSDELIVQKAYHQKHGRLPIEDGIDVLSVQALAFKRFLELGKALSLKIAVVTDLDDDVSDAKARKRFEQFEVSQRVKGFVGNVADGRTLEPQLVSSAGRAALNTVFGWNTITDDELVDKMTASKTEAALRIFEHASDITMPEYINDAIKFVE